MMNQTPNKIKKLDEEPSCGGATTQMCYLNYHFGKSINKRGENPYG
jgi:hypothetical protein